MLHWIGGLALPLGLVPHIQLGRRRALPAIAQQQPPQDFMSSPVVQSASQN